MSLIALCVLSLSFFVVYSRELDIQETFSFCLAENREEWSYGGLLNGERRWNRRFEQHCGGREQSPIAINSLNATKDENLAKLTLSNYDQPITKATIENNGHSVEIVPDDGVSRTISVNDEVYSLRQFHFHWGDCSERGSEHTLDGKRYAMEMHFVHMTEDNKIAVVGIFFDEQGDDNEGLEPIVKEFSNVTYKDDETSLTSNIDLTKLLPGNDISVSYYRYPGSLTTPRCAEGVTWSVVPDPISVSTKQMSEFRKLYKTKRGQTFFSCRLVNNFRRVQDLNDREVFRSQ